MKVLKVQVFQLERVNKESCDTDTVDGRFCLVQSVGLGKFLKLNIFYYIYPDLLHVYTIYLDLAQIHSW